MDDRPQATSCRRSPANLRTSVQPVATIGGGGAQNADVQFVDQRPRSEEARDARPAARRQASRTSPGVVDVDTSLNIGKPELSVQRRSAEGGRPRRADRRRGRGAAAAGRRRSGDDLQRGRRAVRSPPARARPRTARPQAAIARADGAVDAAGQRVARQRRRLRAGHGAVRHQPPRAAAAGHGVLQPAADGVAGGGAERDARASSTS